MKKKILLLTLLTDDWKPHSTHKKKSTKRKNVIQQLIWTPFGSRHKLAPRNIQCFSTFVYGIDLNWALWGDWLSEEFFVNWIDLMTNWSSILVFEYFSNNKALPIYRFCMFSGTWNGTECEIAENSYNFHWSWKWKSEFQKTLGSNIIKKWFRSVLPLRCHRRQGVLTAMTFRS